MCFSGRVNLITIWRDNPFMKFQPLQYSSYGKAGFLLLGFQLTGYFTSLKNNYVKK